MGGYWAIELFESGYFQYVWKRLLTISAEDCWGMLTQEVAALHAAFQTVNATRSKNGGAKGRIFVAKAVILLASAKKCRDADHLSNLVYDAQAVDAKTLTADLMVARHQSEGWEIPDYAHDCHTGAGRREGKTKRDFFVDEFEALANRQPGLFESDLQDLKTGRIKLDHTGIPPHPRKR